MNKSRENIKEQPFVIKAETELTDSLFDASNSRK